MQRATRRPAGTLQDCETGRHGWPVTLVSWLILSGTAALIVWLSCAGWTASAAIKRGGRAVQWLLLGVLLGPVGPWIVLRVLTQGCPHCRAPVLRSVYACPNCGENVPRLEKNPAGALWTYRRNW